MCHLSTAQAISARFKIRLKVCFKVPKSRLRFSPVFPVIYIPLLLCLSCGKSVQGPAAVQSQSLANIQVSPPSFFDYGSVAIGSSADQSFNLTNAGSVNATGLTGSFYLSNTFSFKDGSFPGTGGTCGSNLEVGSTCSVVVSFIPKSLGQVSVILAISYNDGSQVKTTSNPFLQGTGIGSTP